MEFSPPLQQGTLIKRYKRFLADVRLDDGEEITIHCPNTGSMKNCLAPGEPCWFSTSDNPKRKYPNTWEIATTPAGHFAGINTGQANALVVEAIEAGLVTELAGYDQLRREVRYGKENSRIDILLESSTGDEHQRCYVEIKSVTLYDDLSNDGLGMFPDAVSSRGTKHLRELMEMKALGHRAVLFFCVQHTGIARVTSADAIDQLYAETLREAVGKGVEVIAYGANITVEEIILARSLPFAFNDE